MQVGKEKLLWMYEKMVQIRYYEETMAAVYMEGKLPPAIQKGLAFDIGAGPVPGEMHLAAGQEPVAVGICAHLTDDDTVVGTHRPHHFAIAKGVPLNPMTAEMFGKVTGLGKGKGHHKCDQQHKRATGHAEFRFGKCGHHVAHHAHRHTHQQHLQKLLNHLVQVGSDTQLQGGHLLAR